ncbi:MAG: 30S ribosomal protein S4 [Atopobiaceae bacterium]|nr:30S ribosomal protein S4 [Atopobiaceae bacterium]
MAIDRTPVLKRCRALDIDPIVMGINKKSNRQSTRRRRQESEYGRQLREKQKAKFIYGVLEKQFRGYYDKAIRIEGITGDNLMRLLEQRLDNVIFRLGFARTRKEARQTVRHGHITVNGKRVDIPSFQVKPGDVVAVANKAKDLLPIKEALIATEHVAVPAWLEVDIEKLTGSVLQAPAHDQIDLVTDETIDPQLIVELYSK